MGQALRCGWTVCCWLATFLLEDFPKTGGRGYLFLRRKRERLWSSMHHGARNTIRLYTAVDGACLFYGLKGEKMERLMGAFSWLQEANVANKVNANTLTLTLLTKFASNVVNQFCLLAWTISFL